MYFLFHRKFDIRRAILTLNALNEFSRPSQDQKSEFIFLSIFTEASSILYNTQTVPD